MASFIIGQNKNMRKKAFSIIISILIIISSVVCVPVVSASDKTKNYISSMSTEEKISQMLMPSFRWQTDENDNRTNVTEVTQNIENSIKKHGYAGVILFAQNTSTNEKTVRFTDALQKANASIDGRPQLLIATDQEGGNVTRLSQGTMFQGNMAIGAANDVKLTKEIAGSIAKELLATGINTDFAPDVDINNNPSNPVIGVRSFSDDANTVALHGGTFVRTLNDTGVIATLKHFPGHGDTDTDSHTGLPCINKTYDELKKNELIPFKHCIGADAGAQMIMTAHIVYPQIEKTTYKSKLTGEDIFLPATLSKTIVTDILRKDMGFKGVVITDAMDMDAISKHFDPYDAAKLAIEAGVDIILIPVDTSTKDGLANLDTYISTLAQKADAGEISMEKINEAVSRILKLKENNGLFNVYDSKNTDELVAHAINNVGTKASHDKEWELAKKGITLVKNEDDTLPLTKENQKTVVLVPYDDETIPMNYAVKKLIKEGKLPKGSTVEAYSYRNKTTEDMLPLVKDTNNVVFMSEIYSASALKGDIAKMADAITEEVHKTGGKFILMSVNLPYDVARFQKSDAIVLAYLARSMPEDPEDKETEILQYGPNMPVALYMMFSEEDSPTAKLPVNIPILNDKYEFTANTLYERGFGLSYDKTVLTTTVSDDSTTTTSQPIEDNTNTEKRTEGQPSTDATSSIYAKATIDQTEKQNPSGSNSVQTGQYSIAIILSLILICLSVLFISRYSKKEK